ncbi:calcium-binding protein [Desulfovibrio sp. JC022]|uniref:calcium-binding protein n=1 Tax=Desulfovibrio sp. JC022 TaxID=2593642 RepID=UPI0013CFB44B|nr:calcium-binding protein [Desulfovibrio sp. JC022]NDV24084.1 calcium-binding protein [Desulfovibrio sp. JC022]
MSQNNILSNDEISTPTDQKPQVIDQRPIDISPVSDENSAQPNLEHGVVPGTAPTNSAQQSGLPAGPVHLHNANDFSDQGERFGGVLSPAAGVLNPGEEILADIQEFEPKFLDIPPQPDAKSEAEVAININDNTLNLAIYQIEQEVEEGPQSVANFLALQPIGLGQQPVHEPRATRSKIDQIIDPVETQEITPAPTPSPGPTPEPEPEPQKILYGTPGPDNIKGNSSSTTIYGRAGNDTLTGRNSADTLYGEEGNDTLAPAQGNDVVDGGDGSDTISFASISNDVNITLSSTSGSATIEDGTGAVAYTVDLESVENVIGGSGDDYIRGTTGANTIYGGDGADSVYSNYGSDLIYGGKGNDTLYGRSGSNTIYGEEGNDYLTDGSNNDYISGGSGNDTISLNKGVDTAYGDSGDDKIYVYWDKAYIYAGSGDDKVILADATGPFAAANGTIEGGSGNDTLYGGGINDYIWGGSDDDTIDGKKGNDTLYGDSGNDSIDGSQGDDFIFAGSGNDNIDGGDDTDTLSYINATTSVTVNLESGTATGWGTDTIASIESIIGSNQDDNITSHNSGTESITGGQGADTITLNDASTTKIYYNAIAEGGDHIKNFDSGTDNFNFASSGGFSDTAGFKSYNTDAAGDAYDGTNASIGSNTPTFVYDDHNNQLWYDSNGDNAGGATLISTIDSGDDVVSGDISVS